MLFPIKKFDEKTLSKIDWNCFSIDWNGLWNDPYFWCWLYDFIRNSMSSKIYQQSSNASYQLSVYSKNCYLDLINNDLDMNIYSPGIAIGSLQLFSEEKKRNLQFNSNKPVIGCQSLSFEELQKIEPGLQSGEGGAIYHTIDSSGDIKSYCTALKKKGIELGIQYQMYSNVVSWKLESNNNNKRMKSLSIIPSSPKSSTSLSLSNPSNISKIEADCFIFATGNEINNVSLNLDNIQISWPIRGFAIDAPLSSEAIKSSYFVKHILADDFKKVYIAPLNSEYVRISGIVDILSSNSICKMNSLKNDNNNNNFPAGLKPYSKSLILRNEMLLKSAQEVLPKGYLNPDDSNKPWRYSYCFRPQTMDDLPVFGQSLNYSNVYYHGGHGHLGLTRATGSSHLLAKLVHHNLQNNNNGNNGNKTAIFIPQSDETKHLDQVNIELFSPKRCENMFLTFWRKIFRTKF